MSYCLITYAYSQEKIFKTLAIENCKMIREIDKIRIILDDTLIRKSGIKIDGSYRWYDHTINRVVRVICLVNLGIVVNDKRLFIIPYLLVKKNLDHRGKGINKGEQDRKTTAAIEMIQLSDGLAKRIGGHRKTNHHPS